MKPSAGLAAVPLLSAYAVSKAALCRLTENLAAETRGQGVAVFTVNPGLVRTAMSESANLVVFLATGAADVLTGRYIFASDDVRQMVARAADIVDQDRYVLRGRARSMAAGGCK